MKYTLYNTNVPVCTLTYLEHKRSFRISAYHNPEYAPYGLFLPGIHKMGIPFNEWWKNRLIPRSRFNYRRILDSSTDINELAFRNFGLSLSDQYWIRPEGHDDVQWEDITLFLNDFTYDLDLDSLSLSENMPSPNIALNGNLPKKWIIRDSVRCLCKGGSEPYLQEPLNEVIASRILDALEIPHVRYTYENGLSFCPSFIDEDTEFVPAWNIYCSAKKSNSENTYDFCCRLFEHLDVPFRKELDQMLLSDYLIANEDRHFNNFGFIRDVHTLKWIRFAPLFDNGCSLWYTAQDDQIGMKVESKPFTADPLRQLSFVRDTSAVCLDSLDIDDIMQKILNETQYENIKRAELLSSAVTDHLMYLRDMQ